MLWVRANSRRWLVGSLLLLGALPVLAPTQRARAADDTPPQDVIKALEDVYGVHRGQRRNHAKGTCATGEFVGRPAAAAYSRSALFSGRAVPVVARFSLAGGDPNASDAEKSPRGMALEFRLPGDHLQHMTMLDTPTFFAAMPRTFLDKILALKPDPATGKPDPAALKTAWYQSGPSRYASARMLKPAMPSGSRVSSRRRPASTPGTGWAPNWSTTA